MSPFNPDKFRLDSTSSGGVNSSIDRKIEKLSKKCAELIQKNKHKEAKKILQEIKELKSLRLPEEGGDIQFEVNSTNTELAQTVSELEHTLVTTPLNLDIEKTVVTTPFKPDSLVPDHSSIDDQERTVITTPDPLQDSFVPVSVPVSVPVAVPVAVPEPELEPVPVPVLAPVQIQDHNTVHNPEHFQATDKKSNATIIGVTACVMAFFVMAAFSFFAFKEFPGKGNYFDWLKSESIYQKAESERQQGNFDSATDFYSEALQIYPESAKSFHAKGMIQMLKGNYKEALPNLDKAAQLNIKESRYQRDYINALRLNKEEVKAFDLVSKLDEKETKAPQNKALMALIELKLQQPDAETFMREALTAANDNNLNAERDFYAGCFYRLKGDLDKSIDCFKRACKAEPINALFLVEHIKTKNMHNQIAELESEDLTKIAPKWVGSWFIKGEEKEKASKFAQAADSFAQAAKLDAKNSDRFSKAAQTYLKAGNNTEAIKMAYDGLTARTADFNCLDVIGKADDKISPEKMEELYKKALDNTSDYAAGWSNLAYWQSKQDGKLSQALESQAKAVKLDSKNASNWYKLALYLESCQNNSQAIRAAAEAMSLEPENEKYTELRMKLLSRN